MPFNRNNINIYGTKLLGKLFTKRELSEETVDPVRSQTPALDPVRINLIKGNLCIFKIFFSFINFFIFKHAI